MRRNDLNVGFHVPTFLLSERTQPPWSMRYLHYTRGVKQFGVDYRDKSLRPDNLTGATSGNSATRERLPPSASTERRRVEMWRSVRLSIREICSCLTPSFLAIWVWVIFRALRSSRRVSSSAMSWAARFSIRLRRAGGRVDITSSSVLIARLCSSANATVNCRRILREQSAGESCENLSSPAKRDLAGQ
jgi:hypothetical protein